MKHVLKCTNCGQYTMKDVCPNCNEKAVSSRPAKFSVQDRYARLRRAAKRDELTKKGLLI